MILTYAQTVRAERVISAMKYPKTFGLRDDAHQKRSKAARKGWATRRKNIQKKKRSATK
jgi:hypothetical protein